MIVTRLLRFALLADAIATAATGLLMAAASAPLAGLLGLPERLLLYAGVVLLPYAAAVGFFGLRSVVPAAAVWTIVACNVLWSVDSLVILFTGWVTPTLPGYVFVVGQAVVVAVFAELQYAGLSRAPRSGDHRVSRPATREAV